ncbi:hypothetical protein [Neorhodopirellula pilleata]|uniref:hypothetical protein n=1 Tax=Neorhodopirellula pilleata TaxID=2714738 RepID=UPI0011B751A6|nr:hypothetical protein [Neorhodopirellula pilleata]
MPCSFAIDELADRTNLTTFVTVGELAILQVADNAAQARYRLDRCRTSVERWEYRSRSTEQRAS